MNDYTAKKLGEVMAFIKIGKEQLNKAKNALSEAMEEVEVERISHMYEEHERLINDIAENSEKTEVITEKAEKTSQKLIDMSNVYMKKEEDWQDPSEVIEWLGFFEGGAIVHFRLAEAAAEKLGEVDIASFASSGASSHDNLLEDLEKAIERIAKNKAE